jgi:hypothetical protein
VVHELPSAQTFFSEACAAMKPEATLLFAEPAGHVKPEKFEAELNAAREAGLEVDSRLTIRGSLAAALKKRQR